MPIQCITDKDCTTANLCLNETCVPLTAANLAARIPTWGWAVIALAVVLIILGLVRCLCWPKKRNNSNQQRLDPLSDNNGPAPLPSHYKKPVDLLEVADANRRVENSLLQRHESSAALNSRLEGLRKPSDDMTVYPSSSISQSQYATYEQEYEGQPAYPEMQQKYGSRGQQGYAYNSNQVNYGNNSSLHPTGQYNSTNQIYYSQNKSQNINKKLQNQNYGYQPEF